MPHGLPPDLPFPDPNEISDVQWLLLEVQRLNCCEDAKAEFVRLLKGQAGKVIRFSKRILIHPERLDKAKKLLADGLPTSIVRERLCNAYGCSQSTAYSILQKAIQQANQERAATARRKQQTLL